MQSSMVKKAKKSFHSGTVKKTIKIKASKDKVWRKIGNIVGIIFMVSGCNKNGISVNKEKRHRSSETNHICRWK